MPTAIARTTVVDEPSTEAEILPKDVPATNRFSDPRNFINRELSWLEFNRRVLEEAQDPIQPLIERVKFLTIFSSNLDEFFEIRVAGIKQQIESETSDFGPDGLSPTDTFNNIQRVVRELVAAQYALWNEELLPQLAKNGIRIPKMAELSAKRAAWAHRYFQEEVFPMLTPLAVDASHPFPQLLNKSHNLLVRAKTQRGGEPLHAIVQVPRVLPRLIVMPRGKGEDEPWVYIYLASLIKQHIGELFPGLILDGVHAFRVTRNSDLYIDDEEAENLLRTIEQELRRSSRGNAVRLEVEAVCPKDFLELLFEFFNLSEADAYKLIGPLSMRHFVPLVTYSYMYGVIVRKKQCKALLILRRDDDELRRYVHLATGNYHPRTARIYTDFSLLTSEPQLSEEVATVFNTLTGLAGYPGLKKMMVAPFDMHSRLIKLIERERDNAQAGKPARIVAKLNALVDQEIIEKLYEASCAEVTINLIVRGICCLRPKIPDLSENIRVISIVGRFLEHSRIFHFENAGQPRVFLSSADWMPRNFYRRIELAFPVENQALRDQIINEVLPSFLNDRVKARELQPNGTYRRLKPEGSEPRAQAQWHFREVSRERAKKMTGSKKKLRADKLIPITVASDKSAAPAESGTDQQPTSTPSAKTTKQS